MQVLFSFNLGVVAPPVISTPSMPTSTNVVPVNSMNLANRQTQAPATMSASEQRISNISPSRVPVVDPRLATNPLGNSDHFQPLFVSTGPSNNSSPDIVRKVSKSSQELQKALNTVGNVQTVANDDYLRGLF